MHEWLQAPTPLFRGMRHLEPQIVGTCRRAATSRGHEVALLIIGASISVAALAWPGNGVSAALLGGIVDAFFVVEHAARRLHHGGGSRKSTRLSPSRVR